MSLVRIALRHCLAQTLKGNTIVGDNVEDSAIEAISFREDGKAETVKANPFVAIYTDSGKTDLEGTRFSFAEAEETQVVFEWCTSASMSVFDEGTGERTLGISLPVTSGNMEMQQDIVGRQIIDVLRDPENIYAEFARALVMSSKELIRNRVSNGEGGERLAAHQYIWTCTLTQEPAKGGELHYPFPELFALMEASSDPDEKEKALLMKSLLHADFDEHLSFRHEHGLDLKRIQAIGLNKGGQND